MGFPDPNCRYAAPSTGKSTGKMFDACRTFTHERQRPEVLSNVNDSGIVRARIAFEMPLALKTP